MRRSLLLVCAVALAGVLTQPAGAQPREREAERQERRTETERPSRQQRRSEPDHRQAAAAAARQAQVQNNGGRVLSVEPDGSGYRVRLLKDGEVRTLHVPQD